MSDESESLDNESDKSCFVHLRLSLFLLRFLLLNLLYLLSLGESYLLYDESENDESKSGSSGICSFSLRFDNFVDLVSGLGSGVFVSTGVGSKCDVFRLSCSCQYE